MAECAAIIKGKCMYRLCKGQKLCLRKANLSRALFVRMSKLEPSPSKAKPRKGGKRHG